MSKIPALGAEHALVRLAAQRLAGRFGSVEGCAPGARGLTQRALVDCFRVKFEAVVLLQGHERREGGAVLRARRPVRAKAASRAVRL